MLHVTCTLSQEYNSKCPGLLITPGSCQKQMHVFGGKQSNVGKDWGQEKGATEDEMVGGHHWLDGHKQTPRGGGGQGRLVCCSLGGFKELDIT